VSIYDVIDLSANHAYISILSKSFSCSVSEHWSGSKYWRRVERAVAGHRCSDQHWVPTITISPWVQYAL